MYLLVIFFYLDLLCYSETHYNLGCIHKALRDMLKFPTNKQVNKQIKLLMVKHAPGTQKSHSFQLNYFFIKYISTLYWLIPLTSPTSKEAELFPKSYHSILYRIGNITPVYLHLVEIPSWDHKANKNKGNFPPFILLVLYRKRIQNLQWKPQNKLHYQPWVLYVCDL